MATKLWRRTCLSKFFQGYHKPFVTTTYLNIEDGYRKLLEDREVELLKEKIGKVEITSGSDLSKKKVTFEDLFRRSKFCQLGDVSGSILIGRVVDVVSNDLYIDFGGKFNCVCPRPLVTEVVVDEETKEEQPVSRFDESYTYGTQVKLQLKEFEMAEKFLGSARHTSLLEADAVLLGHVTQKEVLQEELQENILF
ncbi:small ribosomal subunit protein bS1m [Magallana gigas]|uniref:28S ribosomal protein S28, mitochondrial n=1 Tax=Magallana gigas TaxID=29159 RepID=A0A8W8NEB6_MAGGI|nr:28S ribosomal protein S28, mitochondrial-like [Crassostrea gigas]